MEVQVGLTMKNKASHMVKFFGIPFDTDLGLNLLEALDCNQTCLSINNMICL